MLFSNISSAYNARNYLEIKVYPGLEVQLDSNSRNKLDENFYSNLHADLDVAIKNSSSTEDPLSALQLLREKLRLEISQQKLDTANSCNFLCKTMTNAIQKLLINEETIRQMKKGVTGISIIWADVLVKKGDSLSATQHSFFHNQQFLLGLLAPVALSGQFHQVVHVCLEHPVSFVVVELDAVSLNSND
ncbi:uncharacterized protein LOC144424535 [Styela clava]